MKLSRYENTAEEIICEVRRIPLAKIRPNPYQPRKVFSDEAILELARSIKELGLLQPINVRMVGDHYEIIAGERRFRASKLAGFTHINAIVTEKCDKDSAMLAMIENLQRENLNFFEEAEGYQSLIREHGLTQEELAVRLSKNQSTIANKLRILRLPRNVKEKITKNGLTERHARALLRLHNEPAQNRLVDFIIKEGLSVKATERLVENELKRLYGEECEEKMQTIVQFMRDYRIYVNSLKRTVSKITESGVQTQFEYNERDDCVEVVVKLMKHAI